jgi:excisionase family DNA binding protein
MGTTMTVAEAARLIGRTTDAVRKLVERHDVEKLFDANGYTFRVKASDMLRAARKSER